MYNIGNIVFNLTMVFSAAWIVNRFLNTCLEKRRVNVLFIFSWIAFLIFQVQVFQHNGSASMWKPVINIAIVLIISITGYKKKGKAKLFLVVLFYVIWSIIEMVVFFCINSLSESWSQQEKDIIGSVISKICIVIAIYLFPVIWKKRNSETISLKYFLFLLFISLESIFIAANEFFVGRYMDNALLPMITFSILLITNVMVYEMYYRLSENFILEQEKMVYLQQVNFMSKNMDEQKRIMEDFYREKHDLVNEMIALKSSIENSEKETILFNINKIISGYTTDEKYISCGNSIVDAIINFKYAVAKENGIEFEVKIFVPETVPINQCDMGIVLGNAIDNAIEGVSGCTLDDKIIKISMGIKKGELILVVRNPYNHSIMTDGEGNLLTTKKDHKSHGYGVNSIRRVVEKYHGNILLDAQNNFFTITIIMNLGEI